MKTKQHITKGLLKIEIECVKVNLSPHLKIPSNNKHCRTWGDAVHNRLCTT